MARGTNTPSKRKGMSYTKFGYLFIAPFVIAYCLFSLYPLLTTFWYSGTFMQNANANFWGFSRRLRTSSPRRKLLTDMLPLILKDFRLL